MRIKALAASAILAAALIAPAAPAIADDTTPTATPTPTDPADPCGVNGTILRELGNLSGYVHDQQIALDGLNRTAARQQQELERAYRLLNRKNLRIARLKHRIEVLRTGLHS